MVGNISLSSSMRQNLLALQKTTALQDMTQNRLATGKKVNTAIDNPSSFFTAASLTDRASDLSSRLDGIGQALSTLQATSNSLDTLKGLVEQAKALATAALEASGSTTSTLTSVEGKGVEGMSAAAVIAATTATSVTDAWNVTLSNTSDFIISINGSDLTITASVQFATSISALVTYLNNTTVLSANNIKASFNATSRQIEFAGLDGTEVLIDTHATTDAGAYAMFAGAIDATVAFSAPTTETNAAQAFNLNTATATVTVVFTVTNTNTSVTGQAVEISLYTSASISAWLATLNTIDSGLHASYNSSTKKIEFEAEAGTLVAKTDVTGNFAAQVLGGSGAANAVTFGTYNGSAEVSSKFDDFKDVMEEIDQVVADSGYKGTNLLFGSESMTVNFNEDGSSNLTVSGVNFTYNSGLGFSTTSSVSWTATPGHIEKSIDEAREAMDAIRSQAASFGNANAIIQGREDFTTNLVDALTSGSDKLTLADMNEESANMLALQTQRQLATNALSMASQAAQSVLQLFR